MKTLLQTLLLTSVCSVAPCCAPAEIILDEFDDSAMVVSPAMENIFVDTLDVGDFSARREIRIASSATDPVGSFDINLSSSGRMSIQFEEIQRTSAGLPLSAPQFNYYFEPTDATEGGRNNAILFDFVELLGDFQPTYLGATVRDDTNLRESYHIDLFPLEPSNHPFSLAAPFDAFTIRGGAPGLPDPTTLKEIRFDFFFLGHYGELNWSARLERIRFGSTVPEPNGLLLI